MWGELSWGELSLGRVVFGASCPDPVHHHMLMIILELHGKIAKFKVQFGTVVWGLTGNQFLENNTIKFP